MKKSYIILAAAGFVVFFTISALLVMLNAPPHSSTDQLDAADSGPVPIVIEKGQTVTFLAEELAQKKLIRSSAFFKLYLKLSGKDTKLKAGSYRINYGLSAIEIARLFVDGKVNTIRITIPEGYTARQIAIMLEREGITGSREFLDATNSQELLNEIGIPAKSAEGFLFPDTYMVAENTPAAEVVRLLSANFFQKLKKVDGNAGIDGKDLLEKVILASIVEREYRKSEDAGKIARVFLNRLKIGMPLQSCATIVFILTERLGKPHPEKIFFSDLEIKDPYNTYRNRGLPPGPISNPGLTSLNAVFNPPENDYLYFRLSEDGSGLHVFSRSFDEHIQNGISVKGY